MNHKFLQNAKKRKRDEGKEFMTKKLNKVDKEQNKLPSTKDETLDNNNMVTCSFSCIKLFRSGSSHLFFMNASFVLKISRKGVRC